MKNVHVCNIGISVIHGKDHSDNQHFIKKTKDLTMKEMFDITAKLVSEQDEIYGVKAIGWEKSWKYLFGDEQVISLQRTKFYVFWDSVLCLGKIHENPQSNKAWEDRLTWFKSSPEYRFLDRIDGEPLEFEWNTSPGFTTLQLCTKVQELLSRLSNTRQMLNSFLFLQREKMMVTLEEKAKAVENCQSIFVPTRTRLQLFFAQLLL